MVHVKPKRPLTPVPYIQNLINQIVGADSEDKLASLLQDFMAPYRFERPDERNLVNWYKLLNRFDVLLERFVADRNVLAKPLKSDNHKASDRSKSLIPSRHSKKHSALREILAHDEHSPSLPASDLEEYHDSVSGPATATPSEDEPITRALEPSKTPFSPSSALVLLILRVTYCLIRNSSHDTRYIYNSLEHLCALLADGNSPILIITLEIVNMLVQRSPKLRGTRIPITPELTGRLLDLVIGWGGRENGLGMLECCSSNNGESLPRDGSRLYFKYVQTKASPSSASPKKDSEATPRERRLSGIEIHHPRRNILSLSGLSGRTPIAPIPLPSATDFPFSASPGKLAVSSNGTSTSITMDDVGATPCNERWLLTDFASRHNVPKHSLFSFLSAYRRAKRFSLGRNGRVEGTLIRLYAIAALFHIQPLPPQIQDVVAKDPEMLQDIVALARAEFKDGVNDLPTSLRIGAVRCLTAMASDRHRVQNIMSATGVTLHHGPLATVLRAEISTLLSTARPNVQGGTVPDDMIYDDPSTKGATDVDTSKNEFMTEATLTLPTECDRSQPASQQVQLTESLLGLVFSLAMSSGSSGATPLANSGVLGILAPLLGDRDMRHSRVVTQATRAMQGIIEGSSPTVGSQLFRDQDGLSLVAERIAVEVELEISPLTEEERTQLDESVEEEALISRGESRKLYERLGRRQMTPLEALEHQPPSSSSTSRGLLPHCKWSLLRSLHQLLLVSLGSGGSEVRQLVVASRLPLALRKILGQPFMHGGSLFHSAAAVSTDIAHAEPTATSALVKAGLAATVLRSIKLGLPPCGEAVRCVPNLLAALCLAPSAKDTIVSSRPLKQYLLRLATPFYTRSLHGDIPVFIGSTLDELMRHVEALRPNGNDAMNEYLKMSASFVNTDTKGIKLTGTQNGQASQAVTNEPDKTRSKESHRDLVDRNSDRFASPSGDGETVPSDEVLLDKMKLAVANNSSRLAGFAQGSSEHQEGIVAGGGLHQIIHLRNGPALACPEASVRDGYVFSRHYPTPAITIVSLQTSLRNFSSRHGTALLKSLFAVILKDAALVLKLSKELGDVWLPEEEAIFAVPDGQSEQDRVKTRLLLSRALRKLRVDVTLLNGLSRGGPGSSTGAWENAGGSQVASVISTVERAARYHLAVVYTGLTLSAANDGDLNTARVTAAADPELRELEIDEASHLLGDLNKTVGFLISKYKAFEENCKRYRVLPDGADSMRQDVKGLAYHLVTFAVAAQRLYSTLAKGILFSSRRPSRDPARHAASAKALAATIGRIFTLHLKAAAPLWDIKVLTMGCSNVTAAWDYVRGILIEIKGTFFDEGRRSTLSLMLKSFLEAGGAEALLLSTRPAALVNAACASSRILTESIGEGKTKECLNQKFDDVLRDKSFSVGVALLAVSDTLEGMKTNKRLDPLKQSQLVEDVVEDIALSTDSVSNQARGISRIVVSDSASTTTALPAFPVEILRMILSDRNALDALRFQTDNLSEKLLTYAKAASVRRVASDVWSTFCGFMNLLASCPGLGAASEPTGVRGEWTIEEIQRSSLSSALSMLALITESPEALLAAYRPGASSMADILSVVRTSSQKCEEIRKKIGPSIDRETGRNGSTLDSDSPRAHSSANPTSPDPDFIWSLVEMGFPEDLARSALRATGRQSIESAMDWLLAHAGENEDTAGRQEISEAEAELAVGEGRIVNDASNAGDENEDGDGEEDEDDSADGDVEGDGDRERDGDNEGQEQGVNVHGDDNGDVILDGDGGENRPSDSNQEAAENDGSDDDAQRDMTAEEESDSEEEINHGSLTGHDNQDQIMQDTGDEGSDGDQDLQETNSSELRSSDRRDVQSHDSDLRSTAGRTKKSKTISDDFSTREGSTTLSLESDGEKLLQRSCNVDLNVLHGALRRAKLVLDDEIPALLDLAASRIGAIREENSVPSPLDRVVINPVTTDLFMQKKKEVFKVLLQLARIVIDSTDRHVYGEHLPYVAIELLSVLQKDGTLVEEESNSFALLLTEGLKVALTQNEEQMTDVGFESRSSSVALWAHYGGRLSRNALQSCGAFSLALKSLVKFVQDWENVERNQRLEKEASKGKRTSSKNADNEDEKPHQGIKSVRSPSKQETVLLKHMTTCLLLLDARSRYEQKDMLISLSRGSSPSQAAHEGATDQNSGGGEMETEAAAPQNTGSTPASDQYPNSQHLDRNQIVLETHIRDMLGSQGASEMDVDPRFPQLAKEKQSGREREKGKYDPREEDLENAKVSAAKKKGIVLDEAKRDISRIVSNRNRKSSELSGGIEKDTLVKLCLSLLRMWKNLEVGDALPAVLQLLAVLTREWAVARSAIGYGILEALLSLPHLDIKRVSTTDVSAVRTLTKTILRHLVEDPDTLREAMAAEIRMTGKSRPSVSLGSLIAAMAPIVSRDLPCFMAAVGDTIKATHSRGSNIQFQKFVKPSPQDIVAIVEKRPNVKAVLSRLSQLLEIKDDIDLTARPTSLITSSKLMDLQLYALETISELVEVSQVAAGAFIHTPSPSSQVDGSALDFVIQVMLPFSSASNAFPLPFALNSASAELDDVSSGVRNLFSALCSNAANAHDAAVAAVGRAASREAEKDEVSPSVIRGIANCIPSGTRLNVLRAISNSDLPNDLARSLGKLDMAVESNLEVANSVLRALALVGQASTHVSRHGDFGGADVSLANESSRDWMNMRTRDNSLVQSPSYMVL